MDQEPKPGLFSIYSYKPENAGRGPFLVGFLLLIPFIIAFGVWAFYAPLNAASIAEGQVILNQDLKTVQHLEGGMVEKIFVQEGQDIKEGDPVLIIRDYIQRTGLDTLYEQTAAARTLKARLKAEYFEKEEPDFSKAGQGLDIEQSRIDDLIALQKQQFITRVSNFKTRSELVRSQQEQTRVEIQGIIAQRIAAEKQLALFKQEYEDISPLEKKGLVIKTRRVELEKQIAAFEGQLGAFAANIAQLEQSILAADLEILSAKTEMQKLVLDELQSAELSLKQAENEILSLQDTLERTVVVAPVSGKVLNLAVHTIGAVVAPGATIMDIVPQDDRLIVEAKVLPNDIDLVRPGVEAKVMLSAYKQKKVPKLDGVVETVSGDALLDEATGTTYFAARVVVDDTVFKDLKADVELYPGMPAQVFMLDEARTLAEYFAGPIIDATYKAFREE